MGHIRGGTFFWSLSVTSEAALSEGATSPSIFVCAAPVLQALWTCRATALKTHFPKSQVIGFISNLKIIIECLPKAEAILHPRPYFFVPFLWRPGNNKFMFGLFYNHCKQKSQLWKMIMYVCMPIYSGSIHRSIKYAAAILVQLKTSHLCDIFIEAVQLQRESALAQTEGAGHSQLISCLPLSRNSKKSITEWKLEMSVFWGLACCFVQPLLGWTRWLTRCVRSNLDVVIPILYPFLILEMGNTGSTGIWHSMCVCTSTSAYVYIWLKSVHKILAIRATKPFTEREAAPLKAIK